MLVSGPRQKPWPVLRRQPSSARREKARPSSPTSSTLQSERRPRGRLGHRPASGPVTRRVWPIFPDRESWRWPFCPVLWIAGKFMSTTPRPIRSAGRKTVSMVDRPRATAGFDTWSARGGPGRGRGGDRPLPRPRFPRSGATQGPKKRGSSGAGRALQLTAERACFAFRLPVVGVTSWLALAWNPPRVPRGRRNFYQRPILGVDPRARSLLFIGALALGDLSRKESCCRRRSRSRSAHERAMPAARPKQGA